MAFVTPGISIWLSWAATILALVSTAGIFSDLDQPGVRLTCSCPDRSAGCGCFLTGVLVAGLLFVTLQVVVFCLASFLVIGLRGGAWEPGLFIAVPLVVCFFSYLYAVCVLLGVVTSIHRGGRAPPRCCSGFSSSRWAPPSKP